ncbi:bifunctional DNA-formamidopyrimidine glycosylase/DNA-(apurinic or apyrimidinic site) lyase [candidate division Kazan bacterium]|uniref:Bifunctional DNA-formamidopyrimidine glycosylase/DNA-(Apurinic or apyrimidinic site) lyase n=1 Tax=candidate division Kazan bacterium TaxID=2202143 RepID=A0A420ZDL3_UNCK3|nr:MAG: bifunctional DNA-formamidopyrimidine glycosylase/DNA-(apurinic or apyrimidinic site) lyase [candidate division Kazan bacterium]
MPELPEVETVVRGLAKHILGQTIKDVEVLNKKSFQGGPSTSSGNKKLRGLKIKSVSRRGKGIIINLSRNTSLLVHLKMTGQLIYIPTPLRHKGYGGLRRLNLGHPTQDFVNKMPSRHSRVVLKLSRGTLYFNDQRLFGWIRVLPTKELKNDPFLSKLGPDALKISTAHLWAVTKRRPQNPIKAILLDQSVITGLGNIYTDEVLFEAGIRPTRKGKTITKKDVEKLIKAIKKILTKGIKYSGTSIVNYKTPEGSPGQMQNYLKVYSRAGLPCRKCKTSITKTRVANRGTHHCPKCQQ